MWNWPIRISFHNLRDFCCVCWSTFFFFCNDYILKSRRSQAPRIRADVVPKLFLSKVPFRGLKAKFIVWRCWAKISHLKRKIKISSCESLELITTIYDSWGFGVLVWFRSGLILVWVWFEPGLSLVWVWFGSGLGLAWAWFESGLSLIWVWFESGLVLVWVWFRSGLSVIFDKKIE